MYYIYIFFHVCYLFAGRGNIWERKPHGFHQIPKSFFLCYAFYVCFYVLHIHHFGLLMVSVYSRISATLLSFYFTASQLLLFLLLSFCCYISPFKFLR